MVYEKWFISDTHFFHSNMLKFRDKEDSVIRDFPNTFVMNEHIVNKWNSVVQSNDYVYHLGDVTFRYDRPFNELMYSLKGDKRLIVGNHDKLKQPGLLQHFSKVMLWHGFKEENFTASHIPLRLDSLRDGKFNVHGHTHQNILADTHYINVSVEVIDYTPVHIDTIIEWIKQRTS